MDAEQSLVFQLCTDVMRKLVCVTFNRYFNNSCTLQVDTVLDALRASLASGMPWPELVNGKPSGTSF